MSGPHSRGEELQQIEAFLAEQGYRMECDPGSIPGEGHYLVALQGDPDAIDLDTVPTQVVDAARRWSDLLDEIIEED